MRLMSFSLTTAQVIAGTKPVTRRVGWQTLKPGAELWAVEKGMGLKKGEQVRRLRRIRVVSVRREPIQKLLDRYDYGRREVDAEGFPTWTVEEFVYLLCGANKVAPSDEVTRIEFEYVGGGVQ